MSKTSNLVGAYSRYSCTISKEATSAFNEALDGLLGVSYEPVAVSEQLVAGTNYKFFCNTEAAVRFPVNGAAIVSIYKPLDGKAHITSIQNIN